MFDVITIGSGLVDVFVLSPELEVSTNDGKEVLCSAFGQKLSVEKLKVISGGAGTNAAVAFQRLGFKTAAVVELGKDVLANVVLSELQQEGVSTSLIIQEKKEQTGGSVILVGKDGGRTVLVYRGAAGMLDTTDLPLDALASTRLLHISSLGDGVGLLPKVWGLVKHHGIPVTWCPGTAELQALREGNLRIDECAANIVFMNKAEWESIAELHEVVKEKIPVVVITNGAQGGWVYQQGEEKAFEAWSEKSIDDTGAGDSFAAAYAAATLANHSPETALQWGLANASSVVQHLGAKAGLLTRQKIETIVADHARH